MSIFSTNYYNKPKNGIVGIIPLLIIGFLLVAIPLSVYFVRTQQEIRSRAAFTRPEPYETPPPPERPVPTVTPTTTPAPTVSPADCVTSCENFTQLSRAQCEVQCGVASPTPVPTLVPTPSAVAVIPTTTVTPVPTPYCSPNRVTLCRFEGGYCLADLNGGSCEFPATPPPSIPAPTKPPVAVVPGAEDCLFSCIKNGQTPPKCVTICNPPLPSPQPAAQPVAPKAPNTSPIVDKNGCFTQESQAACEGKIAYNACIARGAGAGQCGNEAASRYKQIAENLKAQDPEGFRAKAAYDAAIDKVRRDSPTLGKNLTDEQVIAAATAIVNGDTDATNAIAKAAVNQPIPTTGARCLPNETPAACAGNQAYSRCAKENSGRSDLDAVCRSEAVAAYNAAASQIVANIGYQKFSQLQKYDSAYDGLRIAAGGTAVDDAILTDAADFVVGGLSGSPKDALSAAGTINQKKTAILQAISEAGNLYTLATSGNLSLPDGTSCTYDGGSGALHCPLTVIGLKGSYDFTKNFDKNALAALVAQVQVAIARQKEMATAQAAATEARQKEFIGSYNEAIKGLSSQDYRDLAAGKTIKATKTAPDGTTYNFEVSFANNNFAVIVNGQALPAQSLADLPGSLQFQLKQAVTLVTLDANPKLKNFLNAESGFTGLSTADVKDLQELAIAQACEGNRSICENNPAVLAYYNGVRESQAGQNPVDLYINNIKKKHGGSLSFNKDVDVGNLKSYNIAFDPQKGLSLTYIDEQKRKAQTVALDPTLAYQYVNEKVAVDSARNYFSQGTSTATTLAQILSGEKRTDAVLDEIAKIKEHLDPNSDSYKQTDTLAQAVRDIKSGKSDISYTDQNKQKVDIKLTDTGYNLKLNGTEIIAGVARVDTSIGKAAPVVGPVVDYAKLSAEEQKTRLTQVDLSTLAQAVYGKTLDKLDAGTALQKGDDYYKVARLTWALAIANQIPGLDKLGREKYATDLLTKVAPDAGEVAAGKNITEENLKKDPLLAQLSLVLPNPQNIAFQKQYETVINNAPPSVNPVDELKSISQRLGVPTAQISFSVTDATNYLLGQTIEKTLDTGEKITITLSKCSPIDANPNCVSAQKDGKFLANVRNLNCLDERGRQACGAPETLSTTTAPSSVFRNQFIGTPMQLTEDLIKNQLSGGALNAILGNTDKDRFLSGFPINVVINGQNTALQLDSNNKQNILVAIGGAPAISLPIGSAALSVTIDNPIIKNRQMTLPLSSLKAQDLFFNDVRDKTKQFADNDCGGQLTNDKKKLLCEGLENAINKEASIVRDPFLLATLVAPTDAKKITDVQMVKSSTDLNEPADAAKITLNETGAKLNVRGTNGKIDLAGDAAQRFNYALVTGKIPGTDLKFDEMFNFAKPSAWVQTVAPSTQKDIQRIINSDFRNLSFTDNLVKSTFFAVDVVGNLGNVFGGAVVGGTAKVMDAQKFITCGDRTGSVGNAYQAGSDNAKCTNDTLLSVYDKTKDRSYTDAAGKQQNLYEGLQKGDIGALLELQGQKSQLRGEIQADLGLGKSVEGATIILLTASGLKAGGEVAQAGINVAAKQLEAGTVKKTAEIIADSGVNRFAELFGKTFSDNVVAKAQELATKESLGLVETVQKTFVSTFLKDEGFAALANASKSVPLTNWLAPVAHNIIKIPEFTPLAFTFGGQAYGQSREQADLAAAIVRADTGIRNYQTGSLESAYKGKGLDQKDLSAVAANARLIGAVTDKDITPERLDNINQAIKTDNTEALSPEDKAVLAKLDTYKAISDKSTAVAFAKSTESQIVQNTVNALVGGYLFPIAQMPFMQAAGSTFLGRPASFLRAQITRRPSLAVGERITSSADLTNIKWQGDLAAKVDRAVVGANLDSGKIVGYKVTENGRTSVTFIDAVEAKPLATVDLAVNKQDAIGLKLTDQSVSRAIATRFAGDQTEVKAILGQITAQRGTTLTIDEISAINRQLQSIERTAADLNFLLNPSDLARYTSGVEFKDATSVNDLARRILHDLNVQDQANYFSDSQKISQAKRYAEEIWIATKPTDAGVQAKVAADSYVRSGAKVESLARQAIVAELERRIEEVKADTTKTDDIKINDLKNGVATAVDGIFDSSGLLRTDLRAKALFEVVSEIDRRLPNLEKADRSALVSKVISDIEANLKTTEAKSALIRDVQKEIGADNAGVIVITNRGSVVARSTVDFSQPPASPALASFGVYVPPIASGQAPTAVQAPSAVRPGAVYRFIFGEKTSGGIEVSKNIIARSFDTVGKPYGGLVDRFVGADTKARWEEIIFARNLAEDRSRGGRFADNIALSILGPRSAEAIGRSTALEAAVAKASVPRDLLVSALPASPRLGGPAGEAKPFTGVQAASVISRVGEVEAKITSLKTELAELDKPRITVGEKTAAEVKVAEAVKDRKAIADLQKVLETELTAARQTRDAEVKAFEEAARALSTDPTAAAAVSASHVKAREAEIAVFKLEKQAFILEQFNRIADQNAVKAARLLTMEEYLPTLPVGATQAQRVAAEWVVRSTESKINDIWKSTGKSKDGTVFSFRQNQIEAAINLLSSHKPLSVLKTGGGKSQAIGPLFVQLSYELTGKPGVFSAKDAQSLEVYNVMKPILGNDLYYFRLGRDANNNPIDISVQQAAMARAKFILTEPSDIAFLIDTMRSPGLTDRQQVSAFAAAVQLLGGNKFFDEFPEFLNPKNQWVMSFTSEKTFTGSLAQIEIVSQIQSALHELNVLKDGAVGTSERLSLGNIIAKTQKAPDGTTINLPHFTVEGIRQMTEKLITKGVFGPKIRADQVIEVFQALKPGEQAKLLELFQKGISPETVARAGIVADALNKTATILTTELGSETFERGIGRKGNVQENVRDGDIITALSRKMLSSWVWETPGDVATNLKSVSVNGQTIKTNIFDIYAWANAIGQENIFSGATATPKFVESVAKMLGYSFPADDPAYAASVIGPNGRVTENNLTSLGVGKGVVDGIKKYGELMENGSLNKKFGQTVNTRDIHIVAFNAVTTKEQVLGEFAKIKALGTKRPYVIAAENGTVIEVSFKNGKPFFNRRADAKYTSVNLSTAKPTALERILGTGINDHTVVIILEGKSIGADFPANSDVSFVSILDAGRADMETALQLQGRGKRTADNLLYDGMIAFGVETGATPEENLSKVVDRLNDNARSGSKALLSEAIPALVPAQANIPLYEAYARFMKDGDVASAKKVAAILADLQRTQASFDTNLYKSGAEFGKTLQSQVDGITASFKQIVDANRDFIDQKFTVEEKALLEKNSGKYQVTLKDTGVGDVAKLGLVKDGLEGLVGRLNRELTYEMVDRYQGGDTIKPEISLDLEQKMIEAQGPALEAIDPAAKAIQSQIADQALLDQQKAALAAAKAAPAVQLPQAQPPIKSGQAAPAAQAPQAPAQPVVVQPVVQQNFYLIGREGVDIRIANDFSVSRIHAQVRVASGIAYISDQNSRNGTFVNGQPITAETQLNKGDLVHIGKTDIKFDGVVGLQPKFESLAIPQPVAQTPQAKVKKEIYIYTSSGGQQLIIDFNNDQLLISELERAVKEIDSERQINPSLSRPDLLMNWIQQNVSGSDYLRNKAYEAGGGQVPLGQVIINDSVCRERAFFMHMVLDLLGIPSEVWISDVHGGRHAVVHVTEPGRDIILDTTGYVFYQPILTSQYEKSYITGPVLKYNVSSEVGLPQIAYVPRVGATVPFRSSQPGIAPPPQSFVNNLKQFLGGLTQLLPVQPTKVLDEAALIAEEQRVRPIIDQAFPTPNGFIDITADYRKQIIDEVAKYPSLTPEQKESVAKHTMRILASLGRGSFIGLSIDKIAERTDLNLLNPGESSAISASLQYTLNLGENASVFKNGFDQADNPDHISKLIAAVVVKEAYKTEMPSEMRQSFIRMLSTWDPNYHYQPDRLDDPVNNLVIVKTGPEHLANALAGGVVNIGTSTRTKEQLGITAFHEELHYLIQKQFLSVGETRAPTEKQLEEVVVTALQFLTAQKAGLPVQSVKQLVYWPGARDLVVILEALKKKGLFDWENKENRVKLFEMAGIGDIKLLLEAYESTDVGLYKQLVDHFDIVRDGLYKLSVDEQNARLKLFDEESEKLGLSQQFNQSHPEAAPNAPAVAQPAPIPPEKPTRSVVEATKQALTALPKSQILGRIKSLPVGKTLRFGWDWLNKDIPEDKQETSLTGNRSGLVRKWLNSSLMGARGGAPIWDLGAWNEAIRSDYFWADTTRFLISRLLLGAVPGVGPIMTSVTSFYDTGVRMLGHDLIYGFLHDKWGLLRKPPVPKARPAVIAELEKEFEVAEDRLISEALLNLIAENGQEDKAREDLRARMTLMLGILDNRLTLNDAEKIEFIKKASELFNKAKARYQAQKSQNQPPIESGQAAPGPSGAPAAPAAQVAPKAKELNEATLSDGTIIGNLMFSYISGNITDLQMSVLSEMVLLEDEDKKVSPRYQELARALKLIDAEVDKLFDSFKPTPSSQISDEELLARVRVLPPVRLGSANQAILDKIKILDNDEQAGQVDKRVVEFEKAYWQLHADLKSGKITLEQFGRILSKNATIYDWFTEDGKAWTYQGDWYVWDGNNWIRQAAGVRPKLKPNAPAPVWSGREGTSTVPKPIQKQTVEETFRTRVNQEKANILPQTFIDFLKSKKASDKDKAKKAIEARLAILAEEMGIPKDQQAPLIKSEADRLIAEATSPTSIFNPPFYAVGPTSRRFFGQAIENTFGVPEPINPEPINEEYDLMKEVMELKGIDITKIAGTPDGVHVINFMRNRFLEPAFRRIRPVDSLPQGEIIENGKPVDAKRRAEIEAYYKNKKRSPFLVLRSWLLPTLLKSGKYESINTDIGKLASTNDVDGRPRGIVGDYLIFDVQDAINRFLGGIKALKNGGFRIVRAGGDEFANLVKKESYNPSLVDGVKNAVGTVRNLYRENGVLGYRQAEVKITTETPTDNFEPVSPEAAALTTEEIELRLREIESRLRQFHPELDRIVDSVKAMPDPAQVHAVLQLLSEMLFDPNLGSTIQRLRQSGIDVESYVDQVDYASHIIQTLDSPMRLMRIDIPGLLKVINTKYGIGAGNNLLRYIAEKIVVGGSEAGLSKVRFLRRGASDFFLALPDDDLLVERVRFEIESALQGQYSVAGGEAFPMTVAIADTRVVFSKQTSYETLTEANEEALWHALEELADGVWNETADSMRVKVKKIDSEARWDYYLGYFDPNNRRGANRLVKLGSGLLEKMLPLYDAKTGLPMPEKRQQAKNIIIAALNAYVPIVISPNVSVPAPPPPMTLALDAATTQARSTTDNISTTTLLVKGDSKLSLEVKLFPKNIRQMKFIYQRSSKSAVVELPVIDITQESNVAIPGPDQLIASLVSGRYLILGHSADVAEVALGYFHTPFLDVIPSFGGEGLNLSYEIGRITGGFRRSQLTALSPAIARLASFLVSRGYSRDTLFSYFLLDRTQGQISFGRIIDQIKAQPPRVAPTVQPTQAPARTETSTQAESSKNLTEEKAKVLAGQLLNINYDALPEKSATNPIQRLMIAFSNSSAAFSLFANKLGFFNLYGLYELPHQAGQQLLSKTVIRGLLHDLGLDLTQSVPKVIFDKNHISKTLDTLEADLKKSGETHGGVYYASTVDAQAYPRAYFTAIYDKSDTGHANPKRIAVWISDDQDKDQTNKRQGRLKSAPSTQSGQPLQTAVASVPSTLSFGDRVRRVVDRTNLGLVKFLRLDKLLDQYLYPDLNKIGDVYSFIVDNRSLNIPWDQIEYHEKVLAEADNLYRQYQGGSLYLPIEEEVRSIVRQNTEDVVNAGTQLTPDDFTVYIEQIAPTKEQVREITPQSFVQAKIAKNFGPERALSIINYANFIQQELSDPNFSSAQYTTDYAKIRLYDIYFIKNIFKNPKRREAFHFNGKTPEQQVADIALFLADKENRLRTFPGITDALKGVNDLDKSLASSVFGESYSDAQKRNDVLSEALPVYIVTSDELEALFPFEGQSLYIIDPETGYVFINRDALELSDAWRDQIGSKELEKAMKMSLVHLLLSDPRQIKEAAGEILHQVIEHEESAKDLSAEIKEAVSVEWARQLDEERLSLLLPYWADYHLRTTYLSDVVTQVLDYDKPVKGEEYSTFVARRVQNGLQFYKLLPTIGWKKFVDNYEVKSLGYHYGKPNEPNSDVDWGFPGNYLGYFSDRVRRQQSFFATSLGVPRTTEEEGKIATWLLFAYQIYSYEFQEDHADILSSPYSRDFDFRFRSDHTAKLRQSYYWDRIKKFQQELLEELAKLDKESPSVERDQRRKDLSFLGALAEASLFKNHQIKGLRPFGPDAYVFSELVVSDIGERLQGGVSKTGATDFGFVLKTGITPLDFTKIKTALLPLVAKGAAPSATEQDKNNRIADALGFVESQLAPAVPIKMTSDLVKSIHQRVGRGEVFDAGYFRVTKLESPPGTVDPGEIVVAAEAWAKQFNNRLQEIISRLTTPSHGEVYLTLALLHKEFTRIHPFRNANGRSARVISDIFLSEIKRLRADVGNLDILDIRDDNVWLALRRSSYGLDFTDISNLKKVSEFEKNTAEVIVKSKRFSSLAGLEGDLRAPGKK